jgi:antitoxin PrlF
MWYALIVKILAESKLTTQGQVSVPAEVRRRLGVVPGESLEWEERESGEIVVRRADRMTFAEIRKKFAHLRPARPATIPEMDEAVEKAVAQEHARSLGSKRR